MSPSSVFHMAQGRAGLQSQIIANVATDVTLPRYAMKCSNINAFELRDEDYSQHFGVGAAHLGGTIGTQPTDRFDV